MITVFDDTSIRNCRGWTRREFLRIGSLGLGGLTLQDVMAAQAQAKTSSFMRDKSVIMLFLQGGPPQIETFDPKMQAPADIRSCTGEVKTKLPGITAAATITVCRTSPVSRICLENRCCWHAACAKRAVAS